MFCFLFLTHHVTCDLDIPNFGRPGQALDWDRGGRSGGSGGQLIVTPTVHLWGSPFSVVTAVVELLQGSLLEHALLPRKHDIKIFVVVHTILH